RDGLTGCRDEENSQPRHDQREFHVDSRIGRKVLCVANSYIMAVNLHLNIYFCAPVQNIAVWKEAAGKGATTFNALK
ncbi:hypothetical protein, partial [Pantoea piersonii]|uniref:hypothetical protein n=1 Tax=Pantoea piersonii TaxID=2364647 RepID=UPI0028B17A75